ncbi:MAG: TIR domain-containing protein [Rhodospirillales bacterium]
MTEQRPPRVFISYSHDSPGHAARVLKLANDLRRDGVDAIIDQYLTSPSEGWPAWMDSHISDDDFVVMVCTETYWRRVVRKENPGIGLGVTWEGSLIYNHIYGSDLSRFVPVLLNGGSSSHIPKPVAGGTYYLVDTESGYQGLLGRLFNRPAAKMPPIGARPALPVKPAEWTTRPHPSPSDSSACVEKFLFVTGDQAALFRQELQKLIQIDRELINEKKDTVTASAKLREWKKRVATLSGSDDIYKIEADDDRKGKGMYGELRNTMKKCRQYIGEILSAPRS